MGKTRVVLFNYCPRIRNFGVPWKETESAVVDVNDGLRIIVRTDCKEPQPGELLILGTYREETDIAGPIWTITNKEKRNV